MRCSSYFDLREFIPPAIWQRFGEKSIWFMDKKIFLLADFIRSRFNKPMTINNWISGGASSLRGFRPPDTTDGGYLSQHKFGRAIDFNIEGSTPEEIQNDIINNFDIYSKAGLTTIEDVAITTGKIADDFAGWTHCDVRQKITEDLLIVKP